MFSHKVRNVIFTAVAWRGLLYPKPSFTLEFHNILHNFILQWRGIQLNLVLPSFLHTTRINEALNHPAWKQIFPEWILCKCHSSFFFISLRCCQTKFLRNSVCLRLAGEKTKIREKSMLYFNISPNAIIFSSIRLLEVKNQKCLFDTFKF